jgi:DNA-3-methyladenine glycosylase II
MPDPDSALQSLAECDPGLAQALEVVREPAVRRRPGGFAGLVRIITEQSVSIAAARSVNARLLDRFAPLTPEAVLSAEPGALVACGLSRPKARYVRALAEAMASGDFSLGDLPADDDEAQAKLQTLLGVGPWTAAIYLLFCEGRMDVWPAGDVALRAAYTAARGWDERPPMKEFDRHARETFAPHRGLAARLLWTYYGYLKDIRTE